MVYMKAQSKPGHFPPEFYADLPTWVKMRVCTCLKKEGWSRNPKTGWWECSICRKPSRYSAVRICENCEDKFVPLNNPNTQPNDWADSCPACL